ncbi:MAG: hypothetical protein ACRD3P_11880 [Terriglobales bacterium]
MPITVFDAIGKFTADTSNLDEFTTKLEHGLTGASEKAAAATLALKAAQGEFRDSIKALSAEGGNTAENMARLAEAERGLTLATAAARREHSALKQELTGTAQASGIAAQATDELTAKLTSMFGLIAAFEGFKRLIESTQKYVLNLELLSEKTGIAIATLAGIQHVAESNGIAFDEIASALTRLARAQILAIEGGKQQVAAFERIGISANELKNLSPEQLFYRLAGAMANSSSHAAAVASAFALLGRGGAALIPILRMNTEELHSMVEAAAKASGVSSEAGATAKEWEAQVANVTEAVHSGMIPVMEALVPVMKYVESSFSYTAMAVRDMWAAVAGTTTAIVHSFEGLGTLIADVMHGNWQKLTADAKSVAGEVGKDFSGINEKLKDNFQHTADSIKEIWKKTKPLDPPEDDAGKSGAANSALFKNLEARFAAERAEADAETDLRQQASRAALSGAELTYSQELKLQNQANAEKLDHYKKYLNDSLEAAIAEGAKGRAQAITLMAELDRLEIERQANAKKRWADFHKALHQIMSQPIPLINELPPGMDIIQNEITKGFQDAEAAAHALGVTLKTDLDSSLAAAYDAYAKLNEEFSKGIVTQKDLDNGYIKLIQAQLHYAIETGASTDAVKKLEKELRSLLQTELAHLRAINATPQAIQRVTKAIHDLDAGQDRANHRFKEGGPILQAYLEKVLETGKVGQGVAASLTEAITLTTMAFASGSETMVRAIASIAQAEIQGIAAIADKKGGEQLALAFGSYPDAAGMAQHFTSASLWFALGGAVAALGGPLSGVGNSSSSSGSSHSGTGGPSASSPNVNAQSAPSQVVNMTHFALGALVAQPMLGIVGDSETGGGAEEAILPLTNNKALERIAAAILAPMQQLAHINPSLTIPASMLYPATTVSGSRGDSASGFAGKEEIRELAKAIRANPGQDVNIHLHGSFAALAQEMAKEFNHGTRTGRIKLHSTSTDKTIKKS